MVVTNDSSLADRVRLLRNQTFEEPRFVHRLLGFNYRLTNLQAAIGLAQCERLDEKVAKKRQIAQWYTQLFSQEPDLTLPSEAPWARSVFWMYGIVLEESFGCTRDELMRRLQQRGIGTRPFFHPLHRQPVFTQNSDPRFPKVTGSFPVSDRFGAQGLYLPSGLSLTQEEVEQVVESLRECRGAAVAP